MRFVFGDCELDTERYELRRAGHVVRRPKAFRVLVHLLRHHGRAVAKRDLLQEPGPAPRMSTTRNTPCAIVYKIRQAVGDAGTRQAVIETVRTYEYRFAAAVTTDRPHCSGCRAAGPCGRPHLSLSPSHHVDWGEAPDVEIFYGARQNRPSSSSG